MSRHEGISCDSCLTENFKGKRYKCLICYDYDLCERCYESNSTTARHVNSHPVQCILTRRDCELYYSSESTLQFSQSFTCPYCGQKGFTEVDLVDHVTSNHGQMNIEVICPICAAGPLGRSNVIREDFIGHLNLEHRNPSRDLISFFDEAPRHGVRRIPVPNSRINSARGRRSNMNFSAQNNRDSSDPIAEFLNQLSGVRRTQGSSSLSAPPERQPSRGRSVDKGTKRTVGVTPQSNTTPTTDQSGISLASQQTIVPFHSHFLIPGSLLSCLPESTQIKLEEERANRSLFISKIILKAMNQNTPASAEQYIPPLVGYKNVD
uniref:E3 ubiquitin-protein ligase KCMF1 n=1 Tax=Rhodnius prolixus TaxID=13249 RepID=T1HUH5_RHOPR